MSTRRTSIRVVGGTLFGISLTACQVDPVRPMTSPPAHVISDGAHNNGNDRFYFLPPMVQQPTTTGEFDGNLSPVVEICSLSGATCSTTIATYTLTSGPDGETIKVNAAAESYSVNWKTSTFSLSDGVNYRIVVRVGSTVVGYADIDVAQNASQFKNVSTNDVIGLVDGRTLPIRFRLEASCTPDPTGPWDASADFSETDNPNCEWRSGWVATLGQPFTLYTTHEQQDGGVLAAWRDPYFEQFGGHITPTFQKNISSGTTIYNVAPGQVTLHSGCQNGEMAVLRWTAPATATYDVQAQFLVGNFGNTDAYIILNGNIGSPLLSAPSTNVQPTYTGSLSMTTGQTLDFIVGPGGDGCGGDSTPFTATIQRQ